MQNQINKISFQKISYYLLLVSTFFTPLFFLPNNYLSLAQSKSYFFAFFIILSALFCLASKAKEGCVVVWKSFIPYTLVLLPIIYLISSIYSVNLSRSLIGSGVLIETLNFVGLLVVYSLLIIEHTRSKKNIFLLLSAVSLSLLIVFIFQFIKLFLGESLFLGALFSPFLSLVGSWNDLAVLSGLFVGISLISMEILPIRNIIKGFIFILNLVPLLFLSLLNTNYNIYFISLPLLILIALFALFVLTYSIVVKRRKSESVSYTRLFTSPSAIFFAVTLFLVVFSTPINIKLSKYFNFYYAEFKPSWVSTNKVVSSVISEKPLLGSGPSTFIYNWNANKPEGFVLSNIWNFDYDFGVGFIPTIISTVGLVGFMTWLLFIIAMGYLAYKILFYPVRQKTDAFINSSVAFSTFYLLIALIFYTPGHVLAILTFFFSGIVVSMGIRNGLIKEKKILFSEKVPVLNFIFTFILVVSITAFFAWGYTISKKTASALIVNSSLVKNTSDLNLLRKNIKKGLSLDMNPEFLKILAEVDMSILKSFSNLSQKQIKNSKDTVAEIINEVVVASSQAEVLDPLNFRSKIFSAKTLGSLSFIGVPGALEGASLKFEEARKLNPTSPLPDFEQASLLLSQGEKELALESLEKAVALKPNYIDAYLVMANIYLNNGNKLKAIEILNTAVSNDVNNFNLAYSLGLLQIDANKLTDARNTLSYVLSLNPEFANARYFYASVLYRLGDKESALIELEKLLFLNSENQDLLNAIASIKEGKNPFVPNQNIELEKNQKKFQKVIR